MSEIRGLGRETLLYVVATVGQALTGMAAFYIFSRLLSPEEYGYYFLVLAAAEMTNGIAVGWINYTMMRQLPAVDVADRPPLLGNLAATFLITSVVLSVVTAAVSGGMAIFSLDASLPWLVLILVLPMGALSMSQWLFRAQRRPAHFLATLLIIAFIRVPLGWAALYYLNGTGRMLVAVQIVAVLLTAAWALQQQRERIQFSRLSFSWPTIQPILGYGLPLALVNTGSTLMNSAGRLILGLLVGPAAVGIFAPALRLARQLIELGVRPLTMAFVPISYRIFEHDGEKAAMRALHQTAALLITIATGMGLTLYLLRHALVGALLDPQYAAAADLFGYLAPALALAMLIPLLSKSFEFASKTQSLSWYTLWAGLLNVALNFALIPSMAETGAALAALIAYAVYCATTYWGAQRHYHWAFPWLQPLVVAIPAAVLVGFDLIIPKPAGLLLTLLYLLLYVVVYAGAALLCLRLGPPLLRGQLDFLVQIFRARAAAR